MGNRERLIHGHEMQVVSFLELGDIRGTKQALEAEAALDLEGALAYEAEVQARLMQGQNFREAHQAFRAKREPKFI